MLNTAYEATAAKNAYRKDILQPLQIARVKQVLYPITIPGYDSIYIVAGRSPELDTIPSFSQPIVVGTGRDQFIALDLRGRSSKVLDDGELVIPKNGTEWVMIKQAILQKLWLDGVRDEFYLMSELPVKVYSRWISQRVSQVLTLEPLVSKYLQAAAAWWYLCQHYPETQMGESEYLSKSTYISKMVMIPQDQVYDIISKCGYISNATDFVNKTKNAIESPRYHQLTPHVLFTALAGSWFNARETAGVAIEFPPTFLAMLHTAVNERAYRDTPISKIADQLNQRQTFQQFNVAFNRIVFSDDIAITAPKRFVINNGV
jgi:hypothetical protein